MKDNFPHMQSIRDFRGNRVRWKKHKMPDS